MRSRIDLDAFDAAWSAWLDPSAEPPPELRTLADKLCAEADREVREASFGTDRAEAIARQIYLAVRAQRLRSAPSGQRRSTTGLARWQTLAALARAAQGEARAELLGLAIEVGGGAGSLEPDCIAELAPLLDPIVARASALAALSAGGIDTRAEGLLLGVLPEEDAAALLPSRIDRAAAIEEYDERWDALHDLVREVPEQWERRAEEASRARHGVEVQEAYRLPDGEVDAALEQARIDLERDRWGAPFTAWRLGERARRLPEGERGPILDRAIAAFDAIALTPVSPGNDEWPVGASSARGWRRIPRRASRRCSPGRRMIRRTTIRSGASGSWRRRPLSSTVGRSSMRRTSRRSSASRDRSSRGCVIPRWRA